MKPWKVQKLFGDIAYDLRQRGLLPVAVLLVVGIIAAPVILGGLGGTDSGPGPVTATPAAAGLAPENQAAALAYNPGVRNYKERLGKLSSKDPFAQQFGGADEAATALEQSGIAAGVPTTGGAGGGGDATVTGGGPPASSGGETKRRVRYFYPVTDVAIGEAGSEMNRRRVEAFDQLPNEQAPVVAFLGNPDDRSAVFLISTDVSSFDGDGDCFPARDQCQLLRLKEGDSESLVYAPDGKTYRLKLTSVKVKVTRKPPKR